jgi:hypothetical protein
MLRLIHSRVVVPLANGHRLVSRLRIHTWVQIANVDEASVLFYDTCNLLQVWWPPVIELWWHCLKIDQVPPGVCHLSQSVLNLRGSLTLVNGNGVSPLQKAQPVQVLVLVESSKLCHLPVLGI